MSPRRTPRGEWRACDVSAVILSRILRTVVSVMGLLVVGYLAVPDTAAPAVADGLPAWLPWLGPAGTVIAEQCPTAWTWASRSEQMVKRRAVDGDRRRAGKLGEQWPVPVEQFAPVLRTGVPGRY